MAMRPMDMMKVNPRLALLSGIQTNNCFEVIYPVDFQEAGHIVDDVSLFTVFGKFPLTVVDPRIFLRLWSDPCLLDAV